MVVTWYFIDNQVLLFFFFESPLSTSQNSVLKKRRRQSCLEGGSRLRNTCNIWETVNNPLCKKVLAPIRNKKCVYESYSAFFAYDVGFDFTAKVCWAGHQFTSTHSVFFPHDKFLDFLSTHSWCIIGHGHYMVPHPLTILVWEAFNCLCLRKKAKERGGKSRGKGERLFYSFCLFVIRGEINRK